MELRSVALGLALERNATQRSYVVRGGKTRSMELCSVEDWGWL